MKNKISRAVIKRLPKYYECLVKLDDKGVERTSSAELGELLGSTASQVRQDFNNFGGFGQQGYGYNVKILLYEIAAIIGADRPYKNIIIGCGNVGTALAKFPGFTEYGYNIAAIFDNDKNKVGTEVGGVLVRDVEELEDYINSHRVDMAYITTPRNVAQALCDRVVKCGVKGIWNFSQIRLEVPENVYVESVHLIEELFRLSYYLNDADEEDDD